MFQTCLRWTSNQFTWDGAASSCQSLGGHLAEVDNSRHEYFKDMKKIPTGTFWIALRRRAQWKWKNGRLRPAAFQLQYWVNWKINRNRTATVLNCFAIFKNVVHSLETSETPSYFNYFVTMLFVKLLNRILVCFVIWLLKCCGQWYLMRYGACVSKHVPVFKK